MQLDGAPLVITGAAGDLARAVSADLAAAGARLVLMDRDASGLVAARDHVNEAGKPDAVAGLIACDLSQDSAVADAFTQATEQLGAEPVGLVHLAGRIASRPLVNLLDREGARHSHALWREVVSANLDTSFLVGAAMAERLVKARAPGAIILTSSLAARGNAGQSAYAAAKAGVEALVKVWAKELGPQGVRVNAIAPGFIDTPSTHAALGDAGLEARRKAAPLRQLGGSQAVAQTVRYALTNPFVTGAVLPVDGGASL